MPGNRFSLTVRVSCEIHFICFFHFFAKIREDISFSSDSNVLRFKIMFHINPKLTLWKIAHMSVGSCNLIIFSQKLFNCLHLCRRFHDNQVLSHSTVSLLSDFAYIIIFKRFRDKVLLNQSLQDICHLRHLKSCFFQKFFHTFRS